ncbi:hypothetical protein MCUN1_001212 [Malassezia cuniculi]|uniref:Transmembrane protein n=1 Tax=Malassezia cuniculi TaxID=948313 RepID=A0AAF0EXD0_9BASI|nr:hypothetical protein MCUN1_001212 [Malassezia cuniculi]
MNTAPQIPSAAAAPAKHEQLTANEASALREISANVWRARTIGFFGGAALTYFGLKRANRLPPTTFRAGFITVFGGFIGSFALLPFGIAMSRQSFRQIEDPEHLARVLRQQLEQRKPGAPLVIPEARDLNIDNEKATQDSGSSPWSTDAPSMSDAQVSQQQEPKESGSRWDELRRNRVGQPSAWEHIRQENARKNLKSSEQSAPAESMDSMFGAAPQAAPSWSSIQQQQQQPQQPSPQDSSWGTSQTSFGSSPDIALPQTSADRERARREYEAAFERERQGIDTPMDGDRAWRT